MNEKLSPVGSLASHGGGRTPKRNRNPNRGVVLRLADAALIHRMLEFWMDDRRFDNPIVAFETKRDASDAKERLGAKLIAIFNQHAERDASEIYESIG